MEVKFTIAFIGMLLFVFSIGFGIINFIVDVDSMTNPETETIPNYGKITAVCFILGIVMLCMIE